MQINKIIQNRSARTPGNMQKVSTYQEVSGLAMTDCKPALWKSWLYSSSLCLFSCSLNVEVSLFLAKLFFIVRESDKVLSDLNGKKPKNRYLYRKACSFTLITLMNF